MLFVRHGQSTANATGVWQGQRDYPLSGKGREQALLAGRALAGERMDSIYSSPLSRAFETAEIIAREMQFSGSISPVAELMERAGGLLEGTTAEEREVRNPDLMRKFRNLPEEESWPLVGAETDDEVLERFEVAIGKILRETSGDGERILIVSHGGCLRAYLRHVFGPGALPGRERLPNTSITRVSWPANGHKPRLLELGSTAHLPGEYDSTPPSEGGAE